MSDAKASERVRHVLVDNDGAVTTACGRGIGDPDVQEDFVTTVRDAATCTGCANALRALADELERAQGGGG